MFCKNCGKEVQDNAKFCSSCGSTIENSKEEITAPIQEPDRNIQSNNKDAIKPKKKGRGCLIAVLIILLIPLIGIIIGIINSDGTATTGNSSLSPEELKAQQLEFDAHVWKDFLASYESHHYLVSSIESYADGSATALNAYEYWKKSEKNFGHNSTIFGYGKTDDERTYLSGLETAALADQQACKYLLKYMDSNSMKDLSSAKENIERAKEALIMVAGNRAILLKKIGLTEEEINDLLNKGVAEVEVIDKK